jgi:hypothetical protein
MKLNKIRGKQTTFSGRTCHHQCLAEEQGEALEQELKDIHTDTLVTMQLVLEHTL